MERETFKVRIEKSNERSWYRNQIGDIFEVFDYNEELYGISKSKTAQALYKSDCTVILPKEKPVVEYKCHDCGKPMGDEGNVFTCCSECWDKTYPKKSVDDIEALRLTEKEKYKFAPLPTEEKVSFLNGIDYAENILISKFRPLMEKKDEETTIFQNKLSSSVLKSSALQNQNSNLLIENDSLKAEVQRLKEELKKWDKFSDDYCFNHT